MADEKGVVVRIVYADLSCELLKIKLSTMIAVLNGLVDKESVHLDGKEVIEMHLLSHFNHGNYTKIQGSTSNGFTLMITEKVV